MTETPADRDSLRISPLLDRVNDLERRGAVARKGHRTRRAGRLLDDAESRLRIFQLNPGRADDQMPRAREFLQQAEVLLGQADPHSKAVERHQARLAELTAAADRLAALTVDQLQAELDAARQGFRP